MATYTVYLQRVLETAVEVEASNEDQAMRNAEQEAPGHDYDSGWNATEVHLAE